MSKGINIAERCHVINATPPVDITGGVVNSDVWSMVNYNHCTIILTLGVTGGATTFTVEECDNFTPTNKTAIPFAFYEEETDAGDTLSTRNAATTAGNAASTNDNLIYVIEIDASELTDGRPNLRLVLSDPGGATVASVLVILSGSRYAQEVTPTAIV